VSALQSGGSALAVVGALWAPAAHAQSACSSDGAPALTALRERFISADCEACWTQADPHVQPLPRLALDWIVPSGQGDEAPLSAAATRDALTRLQALTLPVPSPDQTTLHDTRARRPAQAVSARIALGPALNGYAGVSMTVRGLSGPGPWTMWLMLVEHIPAHTEGTPIPRNLVRNLYTGHIDAPASLPLAKHRAHAVSFAMRVPEGAQAERLTLVGGVSQARGPWLTLRQTVCAPVTETR